MLLILFIYHIERRLMIDKRLNVRYRFVIEQTEEPPKPAVRQQSTSQYFVFPTILFSSE